MVDGAAVVPGRPLLVQCTTSQLGRAAQATGGPGSGLVVTVERQNEVATLTATEYLLRVTGYPNPVLLDAARYAGVGRLPASAPFNARWVRRQRDLGLPVLTDSGYVGAGDEAGLRRILDGTARLGGDAIACLPLHISWLRDRTARERLCAHVTSADVPVAVVLEHATDPYALVGVVGGLLALLACGVPVLVLRCDLSALGALCVGAAAAAVGTRASLRHLYPAPQVPRQGGGRPGVPSAIVPACLAYRLVTAIAKAKRRHPDDVDWSCGCDTCAGRDLDWLAAEPGTVGEVRAFQHTVDVLLGLRSELIGGAGDLAESRQSWAARCAAAASRNEELGWFRPGMLARWPEALTAAPSRPWASGIRHRFGSPGAPAWDQPA